jgi:hypothetical protein
LPFDAEIAVKFKAGGTKDEVEDWALEALDQTASATSTELIQAENFMVVVG